MKHSYFCRESVLIKTKYFTFEKCNITISFIKLGDVYIVEFCRLPKYDYVNPTSTWFEALGSTFQSSFSLFMNVVRRYEGYEDLYYSSKFKH